MSRVAVVYTSTAEKNPEVMKRYINDYDSFYLCSSPKEKVLKKDIDLDYSQLEQYDIVCPIGAEPLKYIVGLTGVVKYSGMYIEKRYIPFIHPNLLIFKPQYEDDLKKASDMVSRVLAGEVNSEQNEKRYEFIENQNTLNTWLEQFFSVDEIVVDIETSSLSPRKGRVLGVAISTQPHEGVYISADLIYQNRGRFHKLFLEKRCIFHNSKFDIGFLMYEFGFEFPDFEDTMLLHYCLEEAVGTHGLKALALRFTDLGDYERPLDEYKKQWCRKNKIKLEDFSYEMIPTEILAPYACQDVDGSFQLYKKFKPLVDKNPHFHKLYNTILKPATEALIVLENNGGPIDLEQLVELEEDYQIDVDECLAEIEMHEAVRTYERLNSKTFNPNSTKQLQDLFFKILKLKPIKKTATGAWSVDKEVLGELNHPLAQAILDLREKTKLLSTYVSSIRDGVDKDSRLRSGFNVQGTTSGRLSSSGVLNYQNIPRDNKSIKKLFRARPGYKIVQGD